MPTATSVSGSDAPVTKLQIKGTSNYDPVANPGNDFEFRVYFWKCKPEYWPSKWCTSSSKSRIWNYAICMNPYIGERLVSGWTCPQRSLHVNGNARVGGKTSQGTADGVTLYDAGLVQASRTAAQNVWAAYTTGTTLSLSDQSLVLANYSPPTYDLESLRSPLYRAMTVNDTDKFLVNRSGSSYHLEAQNLMAELS